MHQGNNIWKVEVIKPKLERGTRHFGSIAFAPGLSNEPVHDFRFVGLWQELMPGLAI